MRYLARLDHDAVLEATRHTFPVWGEHRTAEEHAAYNLRQLEEAGPELLRYVGLVDEAGRLVASMKRYSLQLASPAAPDAVVRAVGVGAVFTREDARRRGLGSALLGEVLREARDLGYAAAWLYSDVDPSIYARSGFVALPAWEHRAPAGSLPSDGALATRPLDGDVDRLIALYERSFEGGARWLRPARSRAALRYFRWRNAIRGEHLLLDGAREVGHLVAAPAASKHTLWVDEWSAPGIDPARVWATVRALADAEGCSAVAGWLRPDQLAPWFTPTRRASAIPMVAVIDGSFSIASVPSDYAHFGSVDHF